MTSPQFLKDLEQTFIDEPSMGSVVYLVRKISGHLIETKLTGLSTGKVPEVEVEWLKSYKYVYRLNLRDNVVRAVEATNKHKEEMRLWYEIYEPQRQQLIKLCEENAIKEKKRKKRL